MTSAWWQKCTRSAPPFVEGPAAAPNGDRMVARHPDGSVFEYIETAG